MAERNHIISTPRLVLRNWQESDIEPFVSMNSDATVMKYFPSTLSADQSIAMIERINNHFKKNNFGLYAVEEKRSASFIGFTGFAIPSFESFFTPCVEIGWRYMTAYWHQGFATEAAQACLLYGFNKLGFEKIFSFTATINEPSENLMKRIGMIKVGAFDHPNIEKAHILCKHLLYSIDKASVL